jgi:tetratricopeptide (TPR) repeat protein
MQGQTPDAQKLHQAFWGSFNEFANDTPAALTWYNQLLEEPETPAYMYRGIINLFARANDTSSIVQLMPKIEQAFSDDVAMQLIFAQALYNSGYTVPADEKIIMLAQKVKDHPEVTLLAAQLYMRRKELDNAVLVIKDYLAATPEVMNHFAFHFCLVQIYMLMQQHDAALQALHKALTLQPTFAKGWLMYGFLHEQQHLLDNAILGYTRYLATADKEHPEIALHIQQLATKRQGQTTEKSGLKDDQLQELLKLIKQGNFRQAAEFIDTCLPEQPIKLSYAALTPDDAAQKNTLWEYLRTLYTTGIQICTSITKLFIKPLLPVKYSIEPVISRVAI